MALKLEEGGNKILGVDHFGPFGERETDLDFDNLYKKGANDWKKLNKEDWNLMMYDIQPKWIKKD